MNNSFPLIIIYRWCCITSNLQIPDEKRLWIGISSDTLCSLQKIGPFLFQNKHFWFMFIIILPKFFLYKIWCRFFCITLTHATFSLSTAGFTLKPVWPNLHLYSTLGVFRHVHLQPCMLVFRLAMHNGSNYNKWEGVTCFKEIKWENIYFFHSVDNISLIITKDPKNCTVVLMKNRFYFSSSLFIGTEPNTQCIIFPLEAAVKTLNLGEECICPADPKRVRIGSCFCFFLLFFILQDPCSSQFLP